MKVRLAVRQERCEEVRATLAGCGIEIDAGADLVLSEADGFPDTLLVRDPADGEWVVLPVREIISIETFGHSVEVHAQGKTYQSQDRLYRLAALLDPERFLRISNSVVVARDQVRRIKPALSMKFILTLSDGRRVDVTRSYYYIFKDFFGI